MKPVVAIVGRPNVGKSTLFNRIVGKRHAIVDDMPGVTRDRNALSTDWGGKEFLLLDTGGFTREGETAGDEPHHISAAVREQVIRAIEEADVILFVSDLRSGITDLDHEIADMLRKRSGGKPIFCVVNKADSEMMRVESEKFRRFGIGEFFPVSALNGDSVADLLDRVTEFFPVDSEAVIEDGKIKLAVIGRPNVGKSSLVNALLGETRQIVTDVAGTTRDSIDTEFKRNNRDYILIDTAGLRKKARVDENVEFFSTLRTEKAIERADVAIAVLDATLGIEKQDLRVINLAIERKRGIMIAVNKWDLIEKDSKTADAYTAALRSHLKSLDFIPIIYISALTKQRVFKVIDMATEVWENRRKRISTSEINKHLLPEFQKTPPWAKNGKEIKIKYITQLSIEPPFFGFFAANAKLIEEPYKRFVENKIREHFGFEGTPIEIQFRLK
ncbi:MAG: ribosome biogenesis GTPase Der [Chloroherpetonaceae bacterium]|nr:ribosome biogenesis GTPase Der [Chloroherpetonaceae bacterium]